MKAIQRLMIAVGLLLLAGCSEGDTPQPVVVRSVRLDSSIGASSRAVIGSGYEKDLDIRFARGDESEERPGSYGMWGHLDAVRQGGLGETPIRFSRVQLYPSEGRLRLHGYYPSTGSPVAGTDSVLFVIDGETDIMSTGLLSGSNASPVESCTFSHLLSQLQFVCYTDKPADWGEIVRIEVTGLPLRGGLLLNEENPVFRPAVDGFRGSLPVQDLSEYKIPALASDGKKPDPKGYILIPVVPSVCLNIVTTRDGTGGEAETTHLAVVTVEGGLQAGRVHRIELFFTASGIEILTVTVTEWKNPPSDGEIIL